MDFIEQYFKHKIEMEKNGFRETNSKFVGDGKIVTYVKYTSL
jgi:hypothetical protein